METDPSAHRVNPWIDHSHMSYDIPLYHPLYTMDCHGVKGLDGVEFVRCVQESFLSQYVEVPTRKSATFYPFIGNWEEQQFYSFKIIMDSTGLVHKLKF